MVMAMEKMVRKKMVIAMEKMVMAMEKRVMAMEKMVRATEKMAMAMLDWYKNLKRSWRS